MGFSARAASPPLPAEIRCRVLFYMMRRKRRVHLLVSEVGQTGGPGRSRDFKPAVIAFLSRRASHHFDLDREGYHLFSPPRFLD